MERKITLSQILYYTFLPMLDRLYTVASTENGLTYVSPDDGDITILEKLFKGFTIQEDESINAESIKQLQEYTQGSRNEFDLVLDIQNGTPFQQSIWKALLDVPYGRTIHYGALAENINNPKAARAVGGAVGQNPISIIIPCHRIIGKNGSLTGYNGGINVKMKLLDIEGIQYTG